jgi:5-oxoprolinase (ATP-hydrolysing) subunit A
MTIDLNCDMGEGMPNDAAILPYISSANIACGYHAGDEETIRRTIDLCLNYNVAIGAHPGFYDKPNFGRVPVHLSAEEIYQLIWNQLVTINDICKEKKARLHHVKPHGALYNMAAIDIQISAAIARAVLDFNPKLIVYGLSGSILIDVAKATGLKTANEVFADRTFQANGSLTSRTHEHALIDKVDECLDQVMQILTTNSVSTITGQVIPIKADTICIHGDGIQAQEFAQEINIRLKKQGIRVGYI